METITETEKLNNAEKILILPSDTDLFHLESFIIIIDLLKIKLKRESLNINHYTCFLICPKLIF